MSAPVRQPANESDFRLIRDEWLATLPIENVDERLFELETTVKALDRFFNPDNLPISRGEQLITRDFNLEMRVVAAACRDIALMARAILKNDAGAFTFRSYVENQMLSDRARDNMSAAGVAQSTPAESLFSLAETFQNLAGAVQPMTKLNSVSYPMFVSVGQLVSRAIASNRFFNPMAGDHFHPAHDRMKNAAVAQVVRGIADRELRKEASIALLCFFRLLGYLSFINTNAEKRDDVRHNLMMLALVHSESRLLIHFFEHEAPGRLAKNKTRGDTGLFLDVCDTLAFQFTMELRKVQQQVLRDMAATGSVSRIRNALQAGVGILRNFYQQSVVLVVQTFSPTIRGVNIFPDFVSKLEQSVRLREDLWLLNKVCDFGEQKLASPSPSATDLAHVLGPLTEFIQYFLDSSYKSVRFGDHDEFDRFFQYVHALAKAPEAASMRAADARKKLEAFNRFVETTMGQVRHREELREIPFDSEHARQKLVRFIA